MFKKSAEQQIIVEADKIASMKESIDALSWDRVAEIGKQLQANSSEEARFEMGRELLSISQANISLLGKLGVATTSFTGKMMPSGVEMLHNGIAAVTLPSGEPVFFAEAFLGQGDESQNAQEGGLREKKNDDRQQDLAVKQIQQEEAIDFQVAALEEPADLLQERVLHASTEEELNVQTRAEAVSSSAEKPAPEDLIPPCNTKTVHQGELPSALDPTDDISRSVRSILFPTDDSAALIPNASSEESDFFKVPESSKDNLIPRGDGAATVTGAAGVFESNEDASKAGVLALGLAQNQIAAGESGGNISVFSSVLDFSATTPEAVLEVEPSKLLEEKTELDAKIVKEALPEHLPEQPLNKGNETTGAEEKVSEEVADKQPASDKSFKLALDALQNDALMEELGIEPEIREALIREVGGDLKMGALKADVIESVVLEPDKSSEAQKLDVFVAESKKLEQGTQEGDPNSRETKDHNEDAPKLNSAVFGEKSEGIAEDLERKAKGFQKRERFAKKKPASKRNFQPRIRKISQKDLANFKQIYASRDGALALYLDSTGHIVAVDSAKLA